MREPKQSKRRIERDRIVGNAKRTRAKIEELFVDAAYWNEHVRQPTEEPIDPDPDGVLRRLADGLDRMLADDTGEGPIPPIGGWLSPVFGRSQSADRKSS